MQDKFLLESPKGMKSPWAPRSSHVVAQCLALSKYFPEKSWLVTHQKFALHLDALMSAITGTEPMARRMQAWSEVQHLA